MKMPSDNESLWKRLNKAGVVDEFCELMFAQETRYEDLLAQLEKWGISSSMGALSRFSDSQRSAWTFRRAQRQYESVLADEGIDLDEATRRVVAERLYNLAASPNVSEKALLRLKDQEIQLAKLRNDGVKLEHAARRLAILERQVEETKEDLRNGSLSEEERSARMRARFGV